MAEDTPTTAVPAAEAGETPVERAPDAEHKPAAADSAPAATTTEEQSAEKANGPEEKTSEPVTTSEEKKEPAEAQAEAPASPTEAAEAKEPEAPAAPETTSTAPAEPASAPEANGTPSSADKSKGKKRKSSGNVPEHKAKANRRKSQTRPTNLYAKPGEYYLARLRSYPPWPSIVCDEEILPQTLLETRPVSAMRPDGTYREDHADGGKRAHERTFPVMFLYTNEFAWIPNMDLKPITPEECKDVSEKNKSKKLVSAYGVASEGHDLPYFKGLLADHQNAVQQENEAEEAKAAAKAEKQSKKNKRKSTDVVEEDEDVEMEDADEPAKKPKSTKKRKKSVDADGESSKPAKTPKTTTKLKLTTPKTPTSETESKPKASRKTKGAGAKKAEKEKPAPSDEEETGTEAKEPEKQVDQSEMKAKREKEILYVRHKLQKCFISRDNPPKEEEMDSMVGFFNKLDQHADLEVSIIRKTKIHKVLRMIVKLSSIPRDEEFHFRQRALDILSKWKNVLDSDTAGPDDKDDEKPKANGLHKEGSAESQTKLEDEEKKEAETKTSKDDTLVTAEEIMPDADTAEKAATEKKEVSEPPKEEPAKEDPKEGEAVQGKGSEEKTAEEKPTEEKAAGEKPAEEKAQEKPVEAAA